MFAGGFVGFLVILEWPGISGWALAAKWELFFAVGTPVGVLDFFGTRVMVNWIARVSTLHLRRIAVAETKLHLEPVTGNPFDFPLKDVDVSPVAAAPGWTEVTLPSGRFVARFFVNERLALTIRAAQAGARPSGPR